jgi:hypothetical protein
MTEPDSAPVPTPRKDEKGHFLPGNKMAGSRKGRINKIPAAIERMFMEALRLAGDDVARAEFAGKRVPAGRGGGVEYLRKQAHENPRVFVAAVASLMAKRMSADNDGGFALHIYAGVPPREDQPGGNGAVIDVPSSASLADVGSQQRLATAAPAPGATASSPGRSG